MLTLEDRVIRIISEQMGVKSSLVLPEKLIGPDLAADSLDVAELVMALEAEFQIEIPDKAADNLRSVKDILAYVLSRLNH